MHALDCTVLMGLAPQHGLRSRRRTGQHCCLKVPKRQPCGASVHALGSVQMQVMGSL